MERFGQRRLSVVEVLLSTSAQVKTFFLIGEYLAFPDVCLSTLSSLKVIASEYPQLCYGSTAYKLGRDFFFPQKIKLTFYQAVFSLVSYGNKAAQ